MDVDDTLCTTDTPAALNQLVILSKVVRIQGSSQLVVDQVLPANRQTEEVHAQVIVEVLHLSNAIRIVVGTIEVPHRRVDLGRITVAVRSAAKVLEQ